jgi:PleD family two-component response regulator
VRVGRREEDPADEPAGERPDLLIIGTAAGEGDPSAIASAWTGRLPRPRAVVLIETLRAVDRLRAIASGIDAVIPVERMLEDLPRYARTLAHAGPPPSTVLLVEHDPARAADATRCLEAANIRVVRCPLAQAVQELLEREVPDLMLLATRLPDGDGATVARIVRNDPRFRLRAERGRRLRELILRDALSGLLNQASLLAELEFAVEYGRRHRGALSLLVFDLDRFHEVNERFGHVVGDQVLRHVATVFRSNVRASDVIGRFGGEEFAMVLRVSARKARRWWPQSCGECSGSSRRRRPRASSFRCT